MWVWKVPLRRPTFYWETFQWEIFQNLIQCTQIHRSNPDRLVWIFCPNGKFSVSSFRSTLEDSDMEVNSDHTFFWQKLCPSKMETFLWQLLKERTMVQQVLNKLGINNSSSMMCSLCSKEMETIDHLFLHCPWTRELWIRSAAQFPRPGNFLKERFDPISAEVKAIRKASWLCSNTIVLRRKAITIASDSKQAVTWINGDGVESLDHIDLI
ncbi:hypothetical protein Ddye_007497 [Dipteronia dyeriana]|uniref:Reverse transcriptase zinc-binding domain-containing protein n=1 Tax=Dipteronia dyeriana TaxID=168575 RepID=A0AAD9XK74_9ROSI|nr:hypothetical protein Ddye_007497 [Dipteronia dyeriana]